MDACGKAGESDKAVQLLERMELEGIESGIITFNVAIDACARVGRKYADVFIGMPVLLCLLGLRCFVCFLKLFPGRRFVAVTRRR